MVNAFVLYVGIALVATLSTRDRGRAEMRPKVFQDLLALFKRGRSSMTAPALCQLSRRG